MQPFQRNGRRMPHRGDASLPAASREGPKPTGAEGTAESQIRAAHPRDAADPERSSREALMDCYNG